MFTNTKYDDTKTNKQTSNSNNKTERDRQTGRQTDRQTGRQTDRQIDRRAGRPTVFGLTWVWPGLTPRSPHRHLHATCGNGQAISTRCRSLTRTRNRRSLASGLARQPQGSRGDQRSRDLRGGRWSWTLNFAQKRS